MSDDDADRWVCVHGHFYQPPRENAWLEIIEPQPSAHPYPDWNQRITAECYRPNAHARIVDAQQRIVRVIDNYERMSFDVGPTLLTWLEREAPDVHASLVAADRRSRDRFSGHGSAMAQGYHHVILPLASPRDQLTQVRWGVADFRRRFGRDPEGMWLPECAVDTASLEALAACGVKFTVLAPHQAQRVRPPGGTTWIDVSGGRIEPGRAYRHALPSGRSIDLFFYDGPTSRAIAFEQLLADGNRFADRIIGSGHGLCHVATDGESYGHHHRFGEMALAWALHVIEIGGRPGARLTNYGEFRARFPATWDVEIVQDTSWSCAHGVERWRADCGCNGGGHPGWNQAWRKPLRDALDWLRDRAAEAFERLGEPLLVDPWAARDAYVEVMLDPAALPVFLAHHLRPGVDPSAHRTKVLELLELQRHAMLMYTSCGWFFDELSGIETVQVLQYAARACELLAALSGEPVEDAFVELLAAAPSNVAAYRDGRGVWKQTVEPTRVDLERVVAHLAVAAAIDVPPKHRIHAYVSEQLDQVTRRAGKARLVAGTVRCTSRRTGAGQDLSYAALHLGEHHVLGGVRRFPGDAEWTPLVEQLTEQFGAADLLATQRTLDRTFGSTFSLASLFKHERERALRHILEGSLRDSESALRGIYDDHAPLLRYLANHDIAVPDTLRLAAELVLRHRLLDALHRVDVRYDEVRAVLGEAADTHVDLDLPQVAYVAGDALARTIARFAAAPDPTLLEQLAKMAEAVARMTSHVDLWQSQNAVVELRDAHLAAWRAGGVAGVRLATAFTRLATALRVYVEQP